MMNLSKSSLVVVFYEIMLFASMLSMAINHGKSDVFLPSILVTVIISIIVTIFGFLVEADHILILSIITLNTLGVLTQSMLAKDYDEINNDVTIYPFLFTIASIALIAFFMLLRKKELIVRLADAYSKWILICGIVTVLIFGIALRFLAKPSGGAYAWIYIGNIQFQPTELMKPFFALWFAFLMNCKLKCKIRFFNHKWVWATAFMLTNAIAFALISELGTLIILTVLFFVLSFLFFDKKRTSLYMLLVFVAFGLLVYGGLGIVHNFYTADSQDTTTEVIEVLDEADKAAAPKESSTGIIGTMNGLYERIQKRFTLWLHFNDPEQSDEATQQLAAQRAAVLGGLTGTTKYPLFHDTLYSSNADFAFVSLILYCGLLTAAICLIMLTLFIWRGLVVAERRNDNIVNHVLCVGATFVVAAGFIIPAASSVSLLPVIGICTSFIGRGGSAQLITFLSCSFLIYMSRSRDFPFKEILYRFVPPEIRRD